MKMSENRDNVVGEWEIEANNVFKGKLIEI